MTYPIIAAPLVRLPMPSRSGLIERILGPCKDHVACTNRDSSGDGDREPTAKCGANWIGGRETCLHEECHEQHDRNAGYGNERPSVLQPRLSEHCPRFALGKSRSWSTASLADATLRVVVVPR